MVEHYALYDEQCQREGVVDFAELLLRTYELLSRNDSCASITAAFLAHAGRRVPGHEHGCSTGGCKLLAGRSDRDVCGRRRRPVDLRVPRRATSPTCGDFAARFPRSNAGASSSSRTTARTAHPRCRERAHQPQPQAPRQEPVDRGGQGRAVARVRGGHRHRRGVVHRRRGQGAHGRRRRARRNRCPVSIECAVARARARAVQRRDSVSRVRRHALFRAAGDQARARVFAAHRRRRTTTVRSCASSIFRRAASARGRSNSCRTRRTTQGHDALAAAACARCARGKAGASIARVS